MTSQKISVENNVVCKFGMGPSRQYFYLKSYNQASIRTKKPGAKSFCKVEQTLTQQNRLYLSTNSQPKV